MLILRFFSMYSRKKSHEITEKNLTFKSSNLLGKSILILVLNKKSKKIELTITCSTVYIFIIKFHGRKVYYKNLQYVMQLTYNIHTIK